jgi:hypothetical protein
MVALVAAAAVTWSGCEHKSRARPTSLITACADANQYVDHLRWSAWSATRAVGTGTLHQNDCTPNCAAGHFHTKHITVRLSKVVQCVPGRREFARVQLVGVQYGTTTFPCSFLKLKP